MGSNSNSSTQSLEFRRQKNKLEMKAQIISFVLSLVLTGIAFLAVASESISHWFTVPFILILAVVQVLFQLYYFMHMKDKGHEGPALFMYSGILFAAIIIAALMTVVWN